MAVSIQAAQEKLMRNGAAGIQQNWQPGVQRVGPQGFCAGLAHLGVNVGGCVSGPGARWQQGVSAVSPAEVAARFQEGASRWAQRFVQKMSGGA